MPNEGKTEVTTNEQGRPLQKSTPMRTLNPFEEMERMFEGFFPRGWMRPFHMERPLWSDLTLPLETKMPHVDILDREEDIVVRAEVPGVDKKDLEITVTENSVTLKGKTSREEKEEKADYYRCEISSGEFTRVLALPSEVDADKAKASFKDGMLEITMPKIAKSKRRTLKLD